MFKKIVKALKRHWERVPFRVEVAWHPWKVGGGCLALDLMYDWRHTTLWMYVSKEPPWAKFNSEHLVIWAGRWMDGLRTKKVAKVTRCGYYGEDIKISWGPFSYHFHDTDFGGAMELYFFGLLVGLYL